MINKNVTTYNLFLQDFHPTSMAIFCPPDIRKILLEEHSKLMLADVLPHWKEKHTNFYHCFARAYSENTRDFTIHRQ
jgi:hypothetical protein